MIDTTKPRRRWLRYSLMTLLVLVVLAGIGMTWVARKMQGVMRRNEAVEAIIVSGGGVQYDFETDQLGKPLAKATRPL